MEMFYLNKNLHKKDANLCDGIAFVCLCQNSEMDKVKLCCSTYSLQWFMYLHDYTLSSITVLFSAPTKKYSGAPISDLSGGQVSYILIKKNLKCGLRTNRELLL